MSVITSEYISNELCTFPLNYSIKYVFKNKLYINILMHYEYISIFDYSVIFGYLFKTIENLAFKPCIFLNISFCY